MKSHKDKDQDEQTQDVSKALDAPRKKHGTRVTFTFVCSGCGSESTLDYKPKGVAVDELLCATCMEGSENSARWKLIRDKKTWEEGNREFELVCTECGHIEYSNRPPKRGRAHVCRRCYMEQASPDKSRLEGAEAVDSGLKVRRRKKPKTDDESGEK